MLGEAVHGRSRASVLVEVATRMKMEHKAWSMKLD
jgi:hypothetical protein